MKNNNFQKQNNKKYLYNISLIFISNNESKEKEQKRN